MKVGLKIGWHRSVGLGIKVLKHSLVLVSRVYRLRRWFMGGFQLDRALCAPSETRLGAFEWSCSFWVRTKYCT